MNEEETPHQPSVERVKLRLMVLWANAARAGAELGYRDDPALWGPRIEELEAWVLGKLEGELSATDVSLHRLGPGEWNERSAIDNWWDQEAAVSLCWALGLLGDYPGWDEVVDPGVEFFDYPDPETWRPELRLRPLEELENQAMIVETHYWRIRVPDGEGGGAYGRKLMDRAAALGHVRLAEDGDLALSDGTSFQRLSEDELGFLRSAQTERLQGLNWLCGQYPDWDGVTSDTVVGWLWDERADNRVAPMMKTTGTKHLAG